MFSNIKIAVVGLGGRGVGLTKEALIPVCQDWGAEIAAVYDPYEDRVESFAQMINDMTGKMPIKAESYQEILENKEISAVILTSAWEAHIPQAVEAMKAGKPVAFEVGGAYTVEDCWKLVDTYEQTGVPCMMLENCCYGKWELMVLNMVRQGTFGEIVHCSGGYHHDLRKEIAGGEKNRHYRLRNYLNRNCENYPTHELGPIAKVLDINNGNRMVSLSSTSSCAKGMHAYILETEGEESPLASAEFAQGDIVTTVIKCAKGQTIVLTLDTTLPRAYSRGFTVRGTKGAFFEDTKMVFIDDLEKDYHFAADILKDNAEQYFEKYKHPLWDEYEPVGGHGGMDYLVLSAFMESVVNGFTPPIDVYDAAAYMCITALSEESILKGGAVVAIPDFTRGKWYMRSDVTQGKFKLSK